MCSPSPSLPGSRRERQRERVEEERPTDTNTLARTHAQVRTQACRTHAQVRTHAPCTQARAQDRPPQHARRHAGMGCTRTNAPASLLSTQERPCTSLGTLPRKLLGTPIWKACRGLVRRCPRGSGWRSISVDGAGLGQSQSGRPGSGSCLLGASFSGAPSSRRLRADSLPRVTRHGNPQRCSIRRWWGKLRGAGLERGVSRRGAGQL